MRGGAEKSFFDDTKCTKTAWQYAIRAAGDKGRLSRGAGPRGGKEARNMGEERLPPEAAAGAGKERRTRKAAAGAGEKKPPRGHAAGADEKKPLREHVAGAGEVLEYLTCVLRGEEDGELKNATARMKAAELLGKRMGLFEEGAEAVQEPVVIIDDVRAAAVQEPGLIIDGVRATAEE